MTTVLLRAAAATHPPCRDVGVMRDVSSDSAALRHCDNSTVKYSRVIICSRVDGDRVASRRAVGGITGARD